MQRPELCKEGTGDVLICRIAVSEDLSRYSSKRGDISVSAVPREFLR